MDTLSITRSSSGICRVALNRPEKHNALSGAMIAELSSAAAQIAGDNNVRVAVLAAEGATFCAGADLGWMKAQMAATKTQRRSEALKLAKMLHRWSRMPQPVIGRVQGSAYGGGVGLLAVCDLAVVVKSAEFALTEVRLGLIPATISPFVVARTGEPSARRLFMSGQRFGADTAVAVGLATKAVDPEEMDAAVMHEAEAFLQCAPGAVAEAKALSRSLGKQIDGELLELTADRLVARWEQAEAAEGIAAFFERRRPSWAA